MTINERLNSLPDNRFSEQKKRGGHKNIVQPGPTAAASTKGKIAEINAPIYGTTHNHCEHAPEWSARYANEPQRGANYEAESGI